MATKIAESRRYDTGAKPRYRVWHAFNVPSSMDFYSVESPEEAKTLINKLIVEDLEDSSVSSNAFGLEELEEDGYHEWYNEDGDSISDLLDKDEED